MELYENVVFNRRRRANWEMDFSATYLLHGFAMSRYTDYINPKTILSRTSNFGVATYEAVKKMKADGLISGLEDGKELLEVPYKVDMELDLEMDEAGDLVHPFEPVVLPSSDDLEGDAVEVMEVTAITS